MEIRYQLIFEGMKDSLPTTSREVKAELLSKVNLSVDRIREILERPPSVVMESTDETLLKSHRVHLEKAGARLSIGVVTSDTEAPKKRAREAPKESVLTESIRTESYSDTKEVEAFWKDLERASIIETAPAVLKDVKGYQPLPKKAVEPSAVYVPTIWLSLNRNRVLSTELTFSLFFSLVLMVLTMATS